LIKLGKLQPQLMGRAKDVGMLLFVDSTVNSPWFSISFRSRYN